MLVEREVPGSKPGKDLDVVLEKTLILNFFSSSNETVHNPVKKILHVINGRNLYKSLIKCGNQNVHS